MATDEPLRIPASDAYDIARCTKQNHTDWARKNWVTKSSHRTFSELQVIEMTVFSVLAGTLPRLDAATAWIQLRPLVPKMLGETQFAVFYQPNDKEVLFKSGIKAIVDATGGASEHCWLLPVPFRVARARKAIENLRGGLRGGSRS